MASNLSDPSRKEFLVDGIRVEVVRLEDRWASWFQPEGVVGTLPPLPTLKAAQVKAIEEYSGCKVAGAEFQLGSLQSGYLEAVVNC